MKPKTLSSASRFLSTLLVVAGVNAPAGALEATDEPRPGRSAFESTLPGEAHTEWGSILSSVPKGRAMRLSVLNNPYILGKFLEASGDRIRLQQADGTVREVPFAELVRVEAVLTRSRFQTASIGAGVGAAISGFAAALVFAIDKLGTDRSLDGKICSATGTLGVRIEVRCKTAGDYAAYVGVGALSGAIIGAATRERGEHYVALSQGRTSLLVSPRRQGLGARVSVRF